MLLKCMGGERCTLLTVLYFWFLSMWCFGGMDPVEMNNIRDTGEKVCLKILGDILLQDILAHKQYKL